MASSPCGIDALCGISNSFPLLSPSRRQVTHALLTRPPLIRSEQAPIFFVRLECVKHAASVHPEPGSNSRIKYFTVLGTAIYLFELDSLFLLFPWVSQFVFESCVLLWNLTSSLVRLFDVPCFVFSSFVVQFSRYRSLPLFATAYLVYHTQFRLSRGFLNFFQVSFRHFRPPQVTLPCSSSLSSCLSAPSGTGSLAELYYITTFLSFCQPLFSSFFTFFLFFSTFRRFLLLFLPFSLPVSVLRQLFRCFFSLWLGSQKRTVFGYSFAARH